MFRVFAENDIGVGEAIELTEQVTAKNTFGDFVVFDKKKFICCI